LGGVEDYEKLGAFYLGRLLDPESGEPGPEPLLYDARDLTTHAVIVGMTGSGKTGLAVTLLEEAAIDGVPVIAVDPKGDLGNLLLTFPELRPEDFLPWIDAGAAARAGRTPEEEAREVAALWRRGLADSGQEPARIARFASSAERALYTPGSRAGIPLSVLRSLAAPRAALARDEEALRERVQASVSGLLGLVGRDADPLRSREHILLATLVERAWREGQSLDLGALVRQVHRPPLERLGALDVESFLPEKERTLLAGAINNLLAAPAFGDWLEGEPLDAARLLYTEEGRPRLSILSIAHLSDAERMFVVTLLLSELVAWMRTQPGSRTLRAVLYMDEVMGYLPPTANPPSKLPMLTLLKQARAYGLGVVLATQNPVDLDYKALSNAGSWFLGRLQTERDKARVIEGLEGASRVAGASFDRARTERILAGLANRSFLLNDVHEDAPLLFQTRFALSYLAGPMTREQIRRLTGGSAEVDAAAGAPGAVAAPGPAAPRERIPAPPEKRPLVPAGVAERFLPAARPAGPGEPLVYRPALLGRATLHYVDASLGLDTWERCALLAPLLPEDGAGDPWESAADLGASAPELREEPEAGARFAPLSAEAGRASSYARWREQLESFLYRSRPHRLWRCRAPEATSRPGESPGEFRGRLRDLAREERDQAVDRLRRRYEPKLRQLEARLAGAEQRIEREREQYQDRKLQSVISIGATLLGALFGRKLASQGQIGRATTAARGVSRAARERGDVGRAEERAEALRDAVSELEAELEAALAELAPLPAPEDLACEEVPVAPRKSDLEVAPPVLVWTPGGTGAARRSEPA